jgi:glycosyltransferase 2 family protein
VTALERHPIDIVRVAIGLVIVVGLGAYVHWSGVTELERDVFHRVNDLPGWLDVPLEAVMQIGTLTAVGIACGAALVFRKWWLALAIALAGVGTWFAARIAKEIVDRGRPLDFLDDVVVRGSRLVSYGYPSAHSAVAAALVTVASPYLPRAWRWVAWSAVVVTGFARLYVGAHFPLDVVGGIALGWSIGSLANFLIGTPDVISRSPSTVGLTAAQTGNS